jgi:hypothetical protein
MNPEQFHFFQDLISGNPLGAVAVLVGVALVLLLLFVGTLRRIHPIVVWLAVAANFFGFSQVFPENRTQKLSMLIGAAVAATVLVGWWSWRIAPGIRRKFNVR